jgi:hypothetical protein
VKVTCANPACKKEVELPSPKAEVLRALERQHGSVPLYWCSVECFGESYVPAPLAAGGRAH